MFGMGYVLNTYKNCVQHNNYRTEQFITSLAVVARQWSHTVSLPVVVNLMNTIIPLPAGWVITCERLVCLSVISSGPAAATPPGGGGGGTTV